MISRMFRYFLVLLFCFSIQLTVSYAQDVRDLVYMTEDYPPWNYAENGKIKGIAPDLIRLMWKKMGYEEQPIKLLPWARGYDFVLKKRNHVLMSMTRTQQREPLFKWVGPIATTKYALVGLEKVNLKVKSIKVAQKYRIGVLREDAAEQILYSMGFEKTKIITVNKIEQAMEMLVSGRVDLVAHDMRSFLQVAEKKGLPLNTFKSVFLLKEEKDHYAFSIETPDALIKRFQKALDSLKIEHQQILDKYLKPHSSTDK